MFLVVFREIFAKFNFYAIYNSDMEGVSVKKGASLVEEEIGMLQGSLRDYKQLVETTRAETVSM